MLQPIHTIQLWGNVYIPRAPLQEALLNVEAEHAKHNFYDPLLFPQAKHAVQDPVIGSVGDVGEVARSALLLLELLKIL